MAVGITPKYSVDYPLTDLRPEQFLILALETAARLGWYLHYQSNTGIIATSIKWKSQVIIRIKENSAVITSSSVTSRLYDSGKNRKNIEQFLDVLGAVKAQIDPEFLSMRYENLSPHLPPAEIDVLLRDAPAERSHAADLLSIFKFTDGYFITPLILNINLLIFILMAVSGVSITEPDTPSLISWGANLRHLSLGSEWWRMISSMFLHIGIVHLLMNMYAFLLIGAQLEPRLGVGRFVFAYLFTGVAASLTSLYWHEFGISAGASGAIFGMYGVFLAMLSSKDVVEKANRKQLFASIAFFIVYNLLGGLQPGIDNAAHIGGLLAGIFLGYAFVPSLRKPAETIVDQETVPEHSDPYY